MIPRSVRIAAPMLLLVASCIARDPAANASDRGATTRVVIRARQQLRTELPGFHEWADSASAPPGFIAGPLVGDFDEDGVLDAVFVGHDAEGERVIAVLSHRGRAIVAPVTGDAHGPPSGARRRFLSDGAINAVRRPLGVTVLERNARGGVYGMYVYAAERFALWVDDE